MILDSRKRLFLFILSVLLLAASAFLLLAVSLGWLSTNRDGDIGGIKMEPQTPDLMVFGDTVKIYRASTDDSYDCVVESGIIYQVDDDGNKTAFSLKGIMPGEEIQITVYLIGATDDELNYQLYLSDIDCGTEQGTEATNGWFRVSEDDDYWHNVLGVYKYRADSTSQNGVTTSVTGDYATEKWMGTYSETASDTIPAQLEIYSGTVTGSHTNALAVTFSVCLSFDQYQDTFRSASLNAISQREFNIGNIYLLCEEVSGS